ncbi:MAG: DUF308 domain-containing protein [Coprococcus sp.]|nr:DUF308 domain-containing protein [Coprococcus sp.]
MFNLVMGVVMIGLGVVSLVAAFFTDQMAGFLFFGTLMLGFGIVELIRSKSVRQKRQAAKDREFDMYTRMAAQFGVNINPITGEIVDKKDKE